MPDLDDELRGGSRRAPVPTWLAPVALVVGLCLLGLLGLLTVLRGDPSPPVAGPEETATAPPTAAPLSNLAAGGTGPLSVGAVCTHTDGSGTLLVQFQLLNTGLGRVTVLAVRPVISGAGTHLADVTLPRSPSCGTPVARTGPSTVLEAGRRVGVQLAIRVPADRAAPYPVLADVDMLSVGEQPATQRVFVLAGPRPRDGAAASAQPTR